MNTGSECTGGLSRPNAGRGASCPSAMTAEPRAPATEFIRFCECLNRCGADYVIVGSEAVAFHGAPRYSADFDAFVRASRANLLR